MSVDDIEVEIVRLMDKCCTDLDWREQATVLNDLKINIDMQLECIAQSQGIELSEVRMIK